jgi:hypothetical protein
MTRSAWLLGIFIVLVLAFFIFLGGTKYNNTAELHDVQYSDESDSYKTIARQERLDKNTVKTFTAIENCDTKMTRHSKQTWFNEIVPKLPSLYQKYDKVTLSKALMLLENPSLGYVQSIASGQKDLNYLIRKQLFPDDFWPQLLSLEQISLLSNLEIEELKKKTNEIGLLINEVTMAIESEKFSISQLSNLMESLKDLNGHGNDMPGHRSAYTILEAIIDQNNEELFFSYINLGGLVPNHELGANALERWLHNNSKKSATKDIQRTNRIPQYLTGFGLPIRVTQQVNNELIEVGAYDTLEIKKPALFEQLLAKYNLVVSEAPSLRELKSNDEVLVIYSELYNRKNDHYMSKYGYSFSHVEACRKQEMFLYEQRNSYKIVDEFVVKYDNNRELIIDELAKIDPSLVDCYKQNQDKQAYAKLHGDALVKPILDDLRKADTDSADVKLEQSQLSEQQLATLFWNTVFYYPEQLNLIVGRNAKPLDNDYKHAAKLSKKQFLLISELGFEFDSKSLSNRSLIEYATSQCNLELVTLLLQKKYPLVFANKGNDALGIALLTRCSSDLQKLELVEQLMATQPTIYHHHKAKMARLRTNNHTGYQLIANRYPELKVSNEQDVGYGLCRI